MGEMKVKVVSRKMVKPLKPTPPHLRRYKISLLDEINPIINHIRLLYFSSKSGIIEPKLEESLAQILPNFYVLAGRYNREKREVDCDDQGALFSTAEANCDLSEIIAADDVETGQLNQLLPVDVAAADEPTDPILAVQINMFRCGGLAIGICASHRVIDTAPFALFIAAWAKAAATNGALLIEPHFDALAGFFPTENWPPPDFPFPETPGRIVARRLVFDAGAIRKLRDRLSEGWKSDRPPSRVVAVSALLAQAILRADISRRGEARPAVIGQHIDIRGQTAPALPKTTFGSWAAVSFLELAADADAADGNFFALAAKIYETTAQGVSDCAGVFGDREFGRGVLVGRVLDTVERAYVADWKLIWVSDMSKFGEYEADFGFGKPEWVSLAALPMENYIVLLNNRSNDGIEAWVYLEESDMGFFRQDKEIPMFSAGL